MTKIFGFKRKKKKKRNLKRMTRKKVIKVGVIVLNFNMKCTVNQYQQKKKIKKMKKICNFQENLVIDYILLKK